MRTQSQNALLLLLHTDQNTSLLHHGHLCVSAHAAALRAEITKKRSESLMKFSDQGRSNCSLITPTDHRSSRLNLTPLLLKTHTIKDTLHSESELKNKYLIVLLIAVYGLERIARQTII